MTTTIVTCDICGASTADTLKDDEYLSIKKVSVPGLADLSRPGFVSVRPVERDKDVCYKCRMAIATAADEAGKQRRKEQGEKT